MLGALGFGFWGFRLFFFFFGASEVEGEEAFEDLVVGKVGRSAVRGGDGGVEFFVGEVEPGGALVVEICQGALFQFCGAVGVVRFEAGIANQAG